MVEAIPSGRLAREDTKRNLEEVNLPSLERLPGELAGAVPPDRSDEPVEVHHPLDDPERKLDPHPLERVELLVEVEVLAGLPRLRRSPVDPGDRIAVLC